MSVRENLGALMARFYSKKESADVANTSAPNSSSVVTYQKTGIQTFTAPSDGYVCFSASTTKESQWRRMSFEVDGVEILSIHPANYYASGWNRIAKGQTITTTFGEGTDGVSIPYRLMFMKSMGGGKETVELLQLLCGGAVCLSGLLNRFSSHSSVANASGSVNNHCRVDALKKLASREKEEQQQPPATVGVAFKATRHGSGFRGMACLLASVLRVKTGSRHHSQLKKVASWFTSSEQTQRTRNSVCGLSRTSHQNSVFTQEVSYAC